MKITKIKQIDWWDPKVRLDAVTYKVWVEHNGLTHLVYFNSETELTAFQKSLEPKIKKAKRPDTPLN